MKKAVYYFISGALLLLALGSVLLEQMDDAVFTLVLSFYVLYAGDTTDRGRPA
jgi:hypothetical protein